jgi:hypothetical protein
MSLMALEKEDDGGVLGDDAGDGDATCLYIPVFLIQFDYFNYMNN